MTETALKVLKYRDSEKTLSLEEPSGQKPEAPEPFHIQTVTEPNRGRPAMLTLGKCFKQAEL